MAFEKEPHCSFCGKKRTEVDQLVEGTESHICNECVEASYALLRGEEASLIEENQEDDANFLPMYQRHTNYINI